MTRRPLACQRYITPNRKPLPLLIFLTGIIVVMVAPAHAATCEDLVSANLPDTTINSASIVQAGQFTPPGLNAPLQVTAICRVTGTTSPAINFEIWLPLNEWNGNFHVSGNGGMAGVISYSSMAAALQRGYAVASTDTGHVRPAAGSFDASWALGHPELVTDFGHRALHLTTVNGKTIIELFYNRPPKYSYYVGCSKGGQQGLMEAQRYPDDFHGIVAGNPANDWTRFYAGAHLWYSLATLQDSRDYIPRSKLPLLADAVNAACDALDGLEDGVLDDPRQCRFEPETLTCPSGQDNDTCLTSAQVQTVKTIWTGAKNSAGETIFPGLVPGGENGPGGGWGTWVTGSEPFASLHWKAAEGFFKYMVFEDPDWNFRTFDFDNDLDFALEKVGGQLDSANPNLDRFLNRGGKLIVYHGWSDPDISPLASINYYEDVLSYYGADMNRKKTLSDTQAFFRLFMVPGLGHCRGGPGYNSLDPLSALEAWVENGIAPQQILGSRIENSMTVRTRPVCPYPSIAKWNGTGNPNDAGSFTCVAE